MEGIRNRVGVSPKHKAHGNIVWYLQTRCIIRISDKKCAKKEESRALFYPFLGPINYYGIVIRITLGCVIDRSFTPIAQ